MLPWLLAGILGAGGLTGQILMQGNDAQGQRTGAKASKRSNEIYDEGVPEEGKMTVEAGHLRVVFEAESAWTIDEIYWNGGKVTGATGHYGTVLVPEGGEWIGTGHTEGGREIVHELGFTVDGSEHAVKPGATIAGDKIQLTKHSTIHRFDAHHLIKITGSGILERAQLTATADHNLSLMYLFMHCIEPDTTKWLAELPDGSYHEGTFECDKDFELETDARWVAEWFPDRELSVLLYLRSIPTPDNSCILLWDQPHYHKFYLKHNHGLSLSKGDRIDHTLIFTVVDGEMGDWTATKAAAEELKRKYPPIAQD